MSGKVSEGKTRHSGASIIRDARSNRLLWRQTLELGPAVGGWRAVCSVACRLAGFGTLPTDPALSVSGVTWQT